MNLAKDIKNKMDKKNVSYFTSYYNAMNCLMCLISLGSHLLALHLATCIYLMTHSKMEEEVVLADIIYHFKNI